MSTSAEPQPTQPQPAPHRSERRVGMIGLGNMGGRMARRLVDHGYTVFGFDTRPGQAEAAGATPTASVSELVEAVDVVAMSLPDSHVIEPVVLGEAGVLPSARSGQVVVDLSTA
ncbi:MAG: NAD(P)-binding domain-containing protein, partial [Acidimicrobiaceae bacterium]|nr:NAD(P)-binding domain-containing protein [Acidimicrobiaceae bacterium]